MVSFKSKLLSLSCICAVFILVGATNMFAATTVDLGGPYTGVVDTPITFTGTASCGDGEGNIITAAWDFGDGTAISWIVAEGTDTVTVEIASHAYEATGTYDVVLTVGCATGTDGAITYGTDTTTATVEEICRGTVECPFDAECGSIADDVCENFAVDCGAFDDCYTCDEGDMICEETPGIDCACDDDWKNHGQYVRCVARAAGDLVDAGLITEAEKDDIVMDAAESDCGSKK